MDIWLRVHSGTGEASGKQDNRSRRGDRISNNGRASIDNRITGSGSGVLTPSPCTQPYPRPVPNVVPGLKECAPKDVLEPTRGQKQRAFPTTFFLELRERAPQDVRGW
ncbi:MAG: hypothetical protein J3R72DRAFT_491486 [Linnemannia gamsii]|nr:MAG: hypothetical protein J3R72DRAFT_491486 [Linnemannia gamsii]